MNTKLENLFGWSALLGILIVPFLLIGAIVANGRIAGFKQVTFNRAQASLSAALSDVHAGNGAIIDPKRYGYFEVHACTNSFAVGGTNYSLAFFTGDEYDFQNQGRLAITTNRQFVWLDHRRGAKLIPDDYKVSRWHTGY
jgi:hypothetical protein